jgi:succinate dehydrogenase / fumarate reductase membrane anchor subunit
MSGEMPGQMTGSRLRSPLGRALGLGSAKEGVDHWWAQRITAIALVPLTLWFVIAVLELIGAGLPTFAAWVGHLLPAVLLILLLVATFYHGALGLQVVIEDYIENEALRLGMMIVMKLAATLLAVLGIFAVVKISFTG